ncbi:hypothetical protein BDV11DRAFT_217012 [Aspergillus similis]
MSVDTDSETLRIIIDTSRGFLGNLTPVFQSYAYRDRAQFQNDLNHAFHTTNNTIKWFLVSAVDNKTFTTKFLKAEEAPFSCWCAYDRTLKLLLINMVKLKAHENAAGLFDSVFLKTLVTPTIVLEVVYSATQSKLQLDVRYWLRGPKGEVKTILTLQIAQNEPRIVIERWESTGNGHGCRQQQVVITGTRSNKVTITVAPLVLESERLFLRALTIPREQNIEIDNEKLEFLATRVWSKQRF